MITYDPDLFTDVLYTALVFLVVTDLLLVIVACCLLDQLTKYRKYLRPAQTPRDLNGRRLKERVWK